MKSPHPHFLASAQALTARVTSDNGSGGSEVVRHNPYVNPYSDSIGTFQKCRTKRTKRTNQPSPTATLDRLPGNGSAVPSALPDHLLTCREVASWLRLNPKTIERWARAGRLPCFRVGGHVLFSRRDIAHFLAERRTD